MGTPPAAPVPTAAGVEAGAGAGAGVVAGVLELTYTGGADGLEEHELVMGF